MAYAKYSKLKRGAGGAHVSAKSRTSDPACSKAVSDWKTSGMTAAVAAVLGKCRAKAHALRTGQMHRAAGNEAKAQVLEHRAATGKVGVRARMEEAKRLRAERAGKSNPEAHVRRLETERRQLVGQIEETSKHVSELRAAGKHQEAIPHVKKLAELAQAHNERAKAVTAHIVAKHKQSPKQAPKTATRPAPTEQEIRQKFRDLTAAESHTNRAKAETADHSDLHALKGAALWKEMRRRGLSKEQMATLHAERMKGQATHQAPAKPSLREQAAAHRATKGTQEQRDRRASLFRDIRAGKQRLRDTTDKLRAEKGTRDERIRRLKERTKGAQKRDKATPAATPTRPRTTEYLESRRKLAGEIRQARKNPPEHLEPAKAKQRLKNAVTAEKQALARKRGSPQRKEQAAALREARSTGTVPRGKGGVDKYRHKLLVEGTNVSNPNRSAVAEAKRDHARIADAERMAHESGIGNSTDSKLMQGHSKDVRRARRAKIDAAGKVLVERLKRARNAVKNNRGLIAKGAAAGALAGLALTGPMLADSSRGRFSRS